jgi:hypothetical protein
MAPVETIGDAYALGWRVRARCAFPPKGPGVFPQFTWPHLGNQPRSAGFLFSERLKDSEPMKKTYHVVGNAGGWAIAEDDTAAAGNYATREGALEAIYLAASNDIKKGLGVTIRIDPPAANEPATGGRS